jgi:hypothetical protein
LSVDVPSRLEHGRCDELRTDVSFAEGLRAHPQTRLPEAVIPAATSCSYIK